MADRVEREAYQEFLEPLTQAVRCITYSPLIADGWKASEQPHSITFPSGDPVQLGGQSRLTLTITHAYRLVAGAGSYGQPKIKTVGYSYEVGDRDTRPILRYDFHPEGRSRVIWPHLHLWGAPTSPVDLRKSHLPTGRVALEAVIRFLITEMAVETMGSTDECLVRLNKLEEAFNNKRTW